MEKMEIVHKAVQTMRVAGLFRVVAGLMLALGFAVAVQAAPVTGDPQGNSFGWIAPSTNALNYAQQTPGHIGVTTPHVLFNMLGLGFVTLDFFNLAPGLAFFETRIDGIQTGVTAHPIVIGDLIHTGGTSVASGATLLGKTFFATQYVDIRLALGGEGDYRFDWVRFEVPEPGVLSLVALGMLGLMFSRRRQTS